MKPTPAILLMFTLFLGSCVTKIDISKEALFKNVVGRPIRTKTPLNLYEIDFQLNGYKDRYQLGGQISAQPLVGIIPTGSSVFFDRAIRRTDMGVSSLYLEGCIPFQTKTYPIACFLGMSNADSKNILIGLHSDYELP